MSSSGNTSEKSELHLPSKNDELRRLEKEAMFGKDITVNCYLPDGRVHKMKVKESNEAGFVKLSLADQCKLPAHQIQLFFEERQLIDPMSLCDHKGIEPPEVDIVVRYINTQ